MSNRLTFSLASLILMFAFVLVTAPVMAQSSPPGVTMTKYVGLSDHNDTTSGQYVATRTDFRVRLKFNNPVDSALARAGVEHRFFNVSTGEYGGSNQVDSITRIDADGAFSGTSNEYVVVVSTDQSVHTSVEIILLKEQVTGTRPPYTLQNSRSTETFVLPPLHAASASFGTPAPTATAGIYTVDLVLTNTMPPGSDGTGDDAAPVSPALTDDYIDVDPTGGADVAVGTVVGAPVTGAGAGKATYPLTVTLKAGVDSVTLSVNPAFVATADADTGTVTIPKPLPALAAPVMTVAAGKNTDGIGDRDNGNIDVSWTWKGDATKLKEFSVNWVPADSTTWKQATIAKDSPKEYTIPRSVLTVGKTYRLDIQAIPLDTTKYATAWSNIRSITAKAAVNPAAPANVKAEVDDSLNRIMVNWTKVDRLTYEVTRTNMEAGVQKTLVYSDLTTSALSIRALPELPVDSPDALQGVEYSFTVIAMDTDNLRSAASTAATATAKVDVKPTVDISTQAHGSNSVTVRFTFAKATMMSAPTKADPNAGTPLDETKYDALGAPDGLAGSTISVMKDAAGTMPATIKPIINADVTRLNNPNVFDVTIDYTGASLPLYVTLYDAPEYVSAIGIDGGALTFVPVADNMSTTPALMVTSSKTAVLDIPTVHDSSGRIELGSRFDNPIVPAHGWAVLVRDVAGSRVYDPQGNTWIRSNGTSLPDLALFLGGRNGINSGTISLHKPASSTAATDDLVISEIMWGVDNGNSADPTCSQWIEFYNTTTAAIDLTGWTINFHRSLVDESNWKTADLVDFASNAGVTDRFPVHKYHEPWAPKGQSGILGYSPSNTSENIVSMFLDINYTQAANKKHVVPSGADAGKWSASVYPQSNLPFGMVGTPGAATTLRIKYAETPISQTLIINEIGNSGNDAHDWVEIYNPTNDPQKINGMRLTTVTNTGTDAAPVGKEEILFIFPDLEIKSKHYVVFTASDPKNAGNDLAAGIDVTKGDLDQPNKGLGSKDGIGHQADNTTAFYYNTSDRGANVVKLPNDDVKRLYILRGNANIGSDPKAQEAVVDVIGSLAIPLRNRTPAGWTGANEEERGRTDTDAAAQRRIFDTKMWPLQTGTTAKNGKFVDNGIPALAKSKVYQRNGTALPNNKDVENHLTSRGYTGVGYDRHAPVNDENGGTPGYANGTVNERDGGGGISALKDQVSISEIMLVPHEAELTDDGEFVIPTRLPRATKLPQWIEIYNSSLTEGVNIKGWKLEIQNTDQDPDLITRDLHSTLTIQENVIIPPNQTVLIVSSAGLHSGNFPGQRVINLFLKGHYRTELSLQNRNDPVLSQVGFHLELRDSKGRHVDAVGNLPASTRRGIQPRESSGYDPEWKMPVMNHPTGPRTSLIRIYDKGKPNSGLLPVATGDLDKGTAVGWRLALDTTFNRVPGHTYYGNSNDYGTPGYRGGGPLPVSLSKFRPERLKATGEVVILWATESELNNAGFNILRSETRDGTYTKINTQLIQGQGTTSERTTYEWKDTTAKPNVAYYYQIQDVSLDGQVNTLRVNRLKGNVNAAGKATTTWGELKALQ